jgi:hypothetical protein
LASVARDCCTGKVEEDDSQPTGGDDSNPTATDDSATNDDTGEKVTKGDSLGRAPTPAAGT